MAEQIRSSQEPTCDESVDPDLTNARVAAPKDTALTPYAEASRRSTGGNAPTPFGPAKRG
jgi:hypothetical protein